MSPRLPNSSRSVWHGGLLVLAIVTLAALWFRMTGLHTENELTRVNTSSSATNPVVLPIVFASSPAHVPTPLDMLLAAARSESDSDRRSEMLEETARTVAPADLPAVLDSVPATDSPATTQFRQILVRRLGEISPETAAAWIARQPNNSQYQPALVQVAIAWAEQDLPAARQWTASLPEGESKNGVLESIAYEAARTEPMTALDIASALPATTERDRLLAFAASQWAVTDAAAATAWAQRVPDPGLSQQLLAEIAVASAKQNALGAAGLAATALSPGATQDRAAVAIVERWVQTSPTEAAAWVAQFPDTPARRQAVQNLVSLWAPQDSQAVAAWVQSLPSGSLRDAGYEALAAKRQGSDAMNWMKPL